MSLLLAGLSVFAFLAVVETHQPPRPSTAFEAIGTHSFPSFIRTHDQTGELTAEWTGHPIGWLAGDELLLMIQYGLDGKHVVAGDPSSGDSYSLAAVGASRLNSSEHPRLARIVDPEQVRPDRLLLLPSALVWSYRSHGYPHRAGAFEVVDGEVVDGEVRRDGLTWLAGRGLRYRLSESPSGRWVAVTERQGGGTQVLYQISADGRGEVEMMRLVEVSEMPLDWPQEESLSPNGEWTASITSSGIELVSSGGRRRTIDVAGAFGPWWSPDSSKLAFESDRTLMVVDLDGNVLAYVESPWGRPRFFEWTEGGISWFASSLGQNDN